ncbi:hypothetical protein PanWU01x14_165770 [Parasponia andersonii]|uniref:Uncharacterized protein n=1 Tax=Parasponia andersonii TaxID=3476 RepID=A0A2P5CBV9_PARAD|nr:hypothetical protein PanWU01x14_165770 [Parasponia andersonii]
MEYVDHEYCELDYDALSFCDLPILDKDVDTELDPSLDSYRQNNNSSPSPEELDDEGEGMFEFYINPDILTDHNVVSAEKEGIVFCGKSIIPPKEVVTRHRRSSGRSSIRRESSFKKNQVPYNNSASTTISTAVTRSSDHRSSSFRLGGPKRPLPGTGSSRCLGGGGGGRKRKVIIGLVRFQLAEPKMELSEMRRRQSRRSPAPMFPAAADRGGGEPGGGGRSSRSTTHWGLFRPLRCRAHFVSAWTKASLRCLPYV